MNRTNQATPPPLPRYGIRDDEMTKPCVVLVNWSGDEATVTAAQSPTETFELLADEDVQALDDEELEVNPYDPATPRWRGVGRKPGALALAVLLGFCLAIGLVALLQPAQAHTGAQSAATDIALR